MCKKCHETQAGPLEGLTVLEVTLIETAVMMALAVELIDMQSVEQIAPVLSKLLKQHMRFSDNGESINDLIDKLAAWKERSKLSQGPDSDEIKLPSKIDWGKVGPSS